MSELEFMREFGKNLSDLLEDAWMTQTELAEETGLSNSTISYYVNGERMPSAKAIVNIMLVLDCEFEELVPFGEMID